MQVPELIEKDGNLIVDNSINLKAENRKVYFWLGFLMLYLIIVFRDIGEWDLIDLFRIRNMRGGYPFEWNWLLIFSFSIVGLLLLIIPIRIIQKIWHIKNPRLIFDTNEQAILRHKKESIPFALIQSVRIKTTIDVNTNLFFSGLLSINTRGGKVYILCEYKDMQKVMAHAQHLALVIGVPIINEVAELEQLADTRILVQEFGLTGRSGNLPKRKDMCDVFMIKDAAESILATSENRKDVLKYVYSLSEEEQVPIYFEPPEFKGTRGHYRSFIHGVKTKNLRKEVKKNELINFLEF